MPRGGALGWRLPTKGGCALKETTAVRTHVSVLLAGVLRILLGFKMVFELALSRRRRFSCQEEEADCQEEAITTCQRRRRPCQEETTGASGGGDKISDQKELTSVG